MTAVEKLVEQTAFKFRQHIRAKAGLPCNWDTISTNMYQFYTDKAFDYLVATGEITVKE